MIKRFLEIGSADFDTCLPLADLRYPSFERLGLPVAQQS